MLNFVSNFYIFMTYDNDDYNPVPLFGTFCAIFSSVWLIYLLPYAWVIFINIINI